MDFLRVFRVLAVAEAVSWLLLIPATIVKYTTGEAGGVQILGPVHGARCAVRRLCSFGLVPVAQK
ncbi:DUF3817 domain-containing protein [Arthrobacter sp. UYCu723]